MTQQNRKKPKSKKKRSNAGRTYQESPAAEVMTVAWSVSVTSAFLCLLVAVAANLYINAFPPAKSMRTFEGLALLTASVSGLVSLPLVGAVLRVRRVPPPRGALVFGLLIALGAIAAVIYRLWR